MEDDSLNFDWSQISSLFRPNFSHIPGDVTFKVLDEENQVVATYEAHKVILAVHSNYLKDIFFGSGVFNRGSNVMPTVVIKGTSKGAFKEFLGFFYRFISDFNYFGIKFGFINHIQIGFKRFLVGIISLGSQT